MRLKKHAIQRDSKKHDKKHWEQQCIWKLDKINKFIPKYMSKLVWEQMNPWICQNH